MTQEAFFAKFRFDPLMRGMVGVEREFFLTDERGMPVEAHWAQRSGYSRLDQAAMDAVMAWRYVPAKRGEVPVAMWFNVPIAFDLKQHKD